MDIARKMEEALLEDLEAIGRDRKHDIISRLPAHMMGSQDRAGNRTVRHTKSVLQCLSSVLHGSTAYIATVRKNIITLNYPVPYQLACNSDYCVLICNATRDLP